MPTSDNRLDLVLKKLSDIDLKLTKLLSSPDKLILIKEEIKKRGHMEKTDLIQVFGFIQARDYIQIKSELEKDPEFEVFSSKGRYPNIHVFVGNHNSLLSRSAKVFKASHIDKEFPISKIKQMWDCDDNSAKKIMMRMRNIFGERIKLRPDLLGFKRVK